MRGQNNVTGRFILLNAWERNLKLHYVYQVVIRSSHLEFVPSKSVATLNNSWYPNTESARKTKHNYIASSVKNL